LSALPAAPQPAPFWRVRPMRRADLPRVAQVEERIYPFPWTLGNFADSLSAGYDGWAFESVDEPPALLGYAVIMWLPDEVHLLNLSVDAPQQGRGLGGQMLHWLMADTAERGARSMLLEVRPSNTVALRLYERLGFTRIGLRRRYYPAHHGSREDAIVMMRRLAEARRDG